jgi:hypothetical protein
VSRIGKALFEAPLGVARLVQAAQAAQSLDANDFALLNQGTSRKSRAMLAGQRQGPLGIDRQRSLSLAQQRDL